MAASDSRFTAAGTLGLEPSKPKYEKGSEISALEQAERAPPGPHQRDVWYSDKGETEAPVTTVLSTSVLASWAQIFLFP